MEDDSKFLADLGFGAPYYDVYLCRSSFPYPENETEVSLFNRELYNQFKLDPEVSHTTRYQIYSPSIWLSRRAGIFKRFKCTVQL
jgi:hypothetical protein